MRAQAKSIATSPPLSWEDLYPARVAKPPRTRKPVPPGPLAGDTIWYEDPVRKGKHAELVRAGMERVRQQGKRIGRPSVVEREGFAQRFACVVERLSEGIVSRRQAARELDIGYATFKRLLDARLSALQTQVLVEDHALVASSR